LIKPYFNDDNEAKRIKYVIEMKDNFLGGSKLLKDAEIDLLKEWVGYSYCATELIYTASKDGFSASSFHSKVDGKGATFVIIKAKVGDFIFGGYAPTSWTTNGSYGNDPKAFVFSVTKKKKMENINASYGNYGGGSYGPTFGGGHDFHLCDNCNTVNSSYSSLGHSYKCPEGITYGSTEAQNYLAGTYNFLVEEFEVFRIVAHE